MSLDGFIRRVGQATPPGRSRARAESELTDTRPLRTPEKVAVALALLVGYAIVFLIVDEWNARSSLASKLRIDPRSPLDAAIPFIPGYVYPYLAYYPWLLVPIPILRTRAQFYGAVYAFVSTQMVAVAIYLIFPSQMERPLVTGEGLTASLVRLVYEVDRGYNIVPSLHVAHSVLVALLYRSLDPRRFPWVALGSGVICASTVFIKQHYLLDIPAGFAVAVACYYPTMALSQRRASPSSDAACSS
jgi:membrane-associated phospholipid phosphatase